LTAPIFAVSDKDGKFVIKNVPPGKYTVEADHRKLGAQTQDVEVKDGDVTVNFTFDREINFEVGEPARTSCGGFFSENERQGANQK
jgi:hypothetical protein